VDKLINSVKLLVDGELIDANKKFPMFSSNHEAYAVLVEEIEEAEYETERIKYYLNNLWMSVKNNSKEYELLKTLKLTAMKAAAENIQIAAMAQKFIDSEAIRENTRVLPTVCSKCKDLIINDESATE